MKLKQFNRFSLLTVVLSGTAIGALVILLRLWTIIPTGYVGVVDTFGQVAEQPLGPGIHFKNPFAKIIKFSTQTKELKETAEAPSKDGLITTVDVSVLYRVDPAKAKQLYQTIGTDYEDVILVPYLRSLLRTATARYSARDLYTSQRQALARQLREDLNQTVASRGLIVDDTPLRNVVLPKSLQESVQAKLQAEQDSLRMQFVLQKERQEADRKRIEAKGIADAQRVISQGLTEKNLRFRQIEAMEQLAKSQNTKIVVMGSDMKEGSVQIQP